MSAIFFFFIGLLLLYFGGNILVKGSVSFALRLSISTLVVGMTVVSFATSAPEILVSIGAAIRGHTDIVFGNVIGSNIANIALVLGIGAALFRFKISLQTRKISFPFLFLCTILLGIILYFFNGIPVYIGFLFVLLLIIFIAILIRNSRKENLKASNENNSLLDKNTISLYKSISFIIIGVVLLKFGADYFVEGAISLAKLFNVSDRVISVTIIAIGTSIPELATTVIAAIRKEESLAVGNLLGSNIFNILAVLGLTALIKDIRLLDYNLLRIDYVLMLAITILLGIFIYFFTEKRISRKEGFILLLVYLIYIIYTIK